MTRLWKKLEIMGYSRAIGILSSMRGQPGITQTQIDSLVEERSRLIAELKASKKLPIHKRFMRGTANA